MDKCECWELRKTIVGWHDKSPLYGQYTKQICNGTKEREECTCGGNVAECNFYPEKRKEGKTLNTAEMWLKAQKDGMCYEAVEQGPDTVILYYQKDKGLFDEDGMRCGPEIWNYFDDLMNEQWRLRTMTKAEAEAKFNIKIVGD